MPKVVHVQSNLPVATRHASTAKSVYIGRGPNGRHLLNTPVGETGWLGNPYPIPKFSREECIARFKTVFLARLERHPDFRTAVLALKEAEEIRCYCAPLPCHGDVIREWLEAQP